MEPCKTIMNRSLNKHIYVQAISSTILLLIVLFMGHLFIPEGVEGIQNTDAALGITKDLVISHPNEAMRNWSGEFVVNGMPKDFEGNPLYEHFSGETPSRHFTFIYYLFFLMQYHYLICSSSGRNNSPLWSLNLKLFFQIAFNIFVNYKLTQWIGMGLHIDGLTAEQMLLCFFLSFAVYIFDGIAKCLPDSMFPDSMFGN